MNFKDIVYKIDSKKTIEGWTKVRCYNKDKAEIGYFEYDVPYEGTVVLQKLFTNCSFRGLGYASILIDLLKHLACTRHEVKYINVLIAPLENKININRLIKLYRNNGFEVKQTDYDEAEGKFYF